MEIQENSSHEVEHSHEHNGVEFVIPSWVGWAVGGFSIGIVIALVADWWLARREERELLERHHLVSQKLTRDVEEDIRQMRRENLADLKKTAPLVDLEAVKARLAGDNHSHDLITRNAKEVDSDESPVL